MSENQESKNLMEKLTQVVSKLEAINSVPASQASINRKPVAAPDSHDEQNLENTIPGPLEDANNEEASCSWAQSKNPLPRRAAITASEAESFLQMVKKINRDAEVMERVERVERQNRKIVILGSMFMTVSLLALSAFGYLMVQGKFSNKEAFLHAGQKVDPPHSSSGEATAKVNGPQLPAPVTAAHDPLPAEPVLKVSDPQPVTTPPDPKPAVAAGPVKYVGYMASNKYHYPDCKWAAGISHYKHRNFSSVKEAREKGYIPCPTCHPPKSD